MTVTLSIMLALDASRPPASCAEWSGVCQEALSFASVLYSEPCTDWSRQPRADFLNLARA